MRSGGRTPDGDDSEAGRRNITRSDVSVPLIRPRPKIRRYYTLDAEVSFEEDSTHEFKGHRDFTMGEIPFRCFRRDINTDRIIRSRAPVSKAINGFLNTGCGGTVYLGISNTGVVLGIGLIQYQRDHIVARLDHLMSCYTPPVEQHRYSIQFIPVVYESDDESSIRGIINYDPRTFECCPETRLRPHVFTSRRCWCDEYATGVYFLGILPPKYVVEISVKPWDPKDKRNKYAVGLMKTYPIHEDETKTVYIRRQSTVISYSAKEISEITRRIVADQYYLKLKRLKERRRDE